MAVFLGAAHTLSALGEGLVGPLRRMRSGGTALRPEEGGMGAIHVGSIAEDILPKGPRRIHRLVDRCLDRVHEELGHPVMDERWACVLATTKGDITALEQGDPEGARLPALAGHVARRWGFATPPWVVSNACASGASAIALAGHLVASGRHDHVVVIGVDVLSRFVIEGFRSLQALANGPCRPFDAHRDGTSLGEACAAVVVSRQASFGQPPLGTLLGAAIAHDANHISGPSRTGEGLVRAIHGAMAKAGLGAEDVHAINAHGTGTAYNDAMESIAFERCGLGGVPMSGTKGWFGHTLGAAGVLETVLALEALNEGVVLRNEGMRTCEVPGRVNALASDLEAAGPVLLKTSSGFGGCNAALLLKARVS